MSNDYTPPPITTPLGQVVNNKRAQQHRNFAMQPTQLSKGEQWLRDNPIPTPMSIVDEFKSMLTPGNMTGANAIQAAIKGKGMSTTKRITTGLTGLVQGLAFAAGGKAGKPAVEGIKNMEIPSKIESGINKLNQTVNTKTGQTVYVHGSPTPNLKELNPSPYDHVVWGQRVNPKTPENAASRILPDGREWTPNDFNTVEEVVQQLGGFADRSGGGKGSLYVTRFDDATSVGKYPELQTRGASTKPVKVDAEITVSGKTPDQITRELNKQLRRSGANIPKIPKK